MSIKFGCHSYSWQMSFEEYKDELPSILEVIQKSGFQGVEPDISMLGKFKNNPKELKNQLEDLNIELGALSVMLKWDELDSGKDNKELDMLLKYLKQFPGTILNILNWPFYKLEEIEKIDVLNMQNRSMENINELAKIANQEGVESTFHPNSSPGSIFRTKKDYEVLFDKINVNYLGYTPDTGHIVNGGMDVYHVFEVSKNLINHVHFKDISKDNEFVPIGTGIIDHDRIVNFLRDVNYNGWIMVEDESELAEKDPNRVTKKCGDYIQKYL